MVYYGAIRDRVRQNGSNAFKTLETNSYVISVIAETYLGIKKFNKDICLLIKSFFKLFFKWVDDTSTKYKIHKTV